MGTRQKALAINLDPTSYGTFAEIGGGQEVARWFFSVGGAAGTVAKTISKTVKIQYDDPEFVVHNIWRLYGGWYDGNPARALLDDLGLDGAIARKGVPAPIQAVPDLIKAAFLSAAHGDAADDPYPSTGSWVDLQRPLTTTLVVGFVLALAALRERGDWISGLLSGLAIGATAMVRPAFALLVVVPFILALRAPRRIAVAGAVLAGYVLCVGPWTVRNAVVAQSFLPFGANKGWSLHLSADQYAGRVSYLLLDADWRHTVDKHAMFEREAAAAIPGDSERAYVARQFAVDESHSRAAVEGFRSLAILPTVRSFVIRNALLWSTYDVSPWAAEGGKFHRLVQIQWLVLALLIVASAVLRRHHLLADWPLWITPVYITALHWVFHGEPRHTTPTRPVLFVYAGVALIALAARLGWARVK